jgi:hypothetical protein
VVVFATGVFCAAATSAIVRIMIGAALVATVSAATVFVLHDNSPYNVSRKSRLTAK